MDATNATTISTFNDTWKELLEMNQPLDFEVFLDSNLLTSIRNNIEIYGMMYSTSGAISTIASTCLIVHILRSDDCLSKTYHRLIFGLSIADILSSLAFILGPIMIPREMDYIIPHAIGNMTTCTLQGFLKDFGLVVAMIYNFCLCFYYLAIIKYNKKDEYIRKNLEPWFHGISIIIPLILCSISHYTFDAYIGGFCTPSIIVTSPPPHCIGHEIGEKIEGFSIPCTYSHWEIDTASDVAFIIILLIIYIIAPCVIVGSMVSMYKFVFKIEQRMYNYGENTLNVRNQPEEDNSGENAQSNNGLMCILSRSCCSSYYHRNDNQSVQMTSSNMRRTSPKREVLHRAVGYALAWGIIFIPYFIAGSFIFYSSPQEKLNIFANLMNAVMVPLQGVANFVVFMSPKVRTIKLRSNREEETLTWVQAFIKAYMSKGTSRRQNNNTGTSTRYKNNTSLPQDTSNRFRKVITPGMSTAANIELDNPNDNDDHHVARKSSEPNTKQTIQCKCNSITIDSSL